MYLLQKIKTKPVERAKLSDFEKIKPTALNVKSASRISLQDSSKPCTDWFKNQLEKSTCAIKVSLILCLFKRYFLN